MKTSNTNLITYQQPLWAFRLEGLCNLANLALILIIVANVLSASSADFLSWTISEATVRAIISNAPLIAAMVMIMSLETAGRVMRRIIPAERVSIREPQGA